MKQKNSSPKLSAVTKINLEGWQSWSDTRRPSGTFPRRNFSPHGQNNFRVNHKSYLVSRKSPPRGWTSWPYFGPNINEQIILSQAKAILDLPAGRHGLDLDLDYLLVDDGWTVWGDWLTTDRKKFPHGLKWLVRQIKSYGLKTGLWWAPLLAKSSSRLYQTHPDWFIPGLEGTKVSPFDFLIPDKRRVLDLENPRVRNYLDLVLDYYTDCGIKLLKSDFLYAFHFNPMFTSSEIPDRLLHALLNKISKRKVYSIACGCPLAPAFGVVDAMRISDDINIPQLNHIWPFNQLVISQRLKQLSSNLVSRISTQTLWHLDPDAYISDPAFGITPAQSQKLASLIKQASGVYFIGDNLTRNFSQHPQTIHSF